VLVIEVGRAPESVMVTGNGFPYRSGDKVLKESEEWINSLKDNYRDRGVEQRPSVAVPEDLDLELLPATAAEPVWLSRRGLVVERHGTPAVYNAAVLLAGREPVTRWHRAQSLRLFRVDGTEETHGGERNVTQIEWLELPIVSLIPTAYQLVRSQIRRSEKLHDLFFKELPEYPTFAWQEAIVNAVAHRDYADQGRGVEVWFYDDRMEVRSPGVPVPPVTIESLSDGRGVHASRNPLIARVLVELGLMREEGEGIPRMFHEMQRSLLQAAQLAVTPDGRLS
jgi:ATP-dependent DNA helicase RecG